MKVIVLIALFVGCALSATTRSPLTKQALLERAHKLEERIASDKARLRAHELANLADIESLDVEDAELRTLSLVIEVSPIDLQQIDKALSDLEDRVEAKVQAIEKKLGITSSPTQGTRRPTSAQPTRPSTARPTSAQPTRPSTARPTSAQPTRPSTARPTSAQPTRPSSARPTSAQPTRPSSARPTSAQPTRPSTARPTVRPTQAPTGKPTGTRAPSTVAPTSRAPSTANPVTRAPSQRPSTAAPTKGSTSSQKVSSAAPASTKA